MTKLYTAGRILIVAVVKSCAFNNSGSNLRESCIVQRSGGLIALPTAAMTIECSADNFEWLWKRTVVERVISEVFFSESLIDRSVSGISLRMNIGMTYQAWETNEIAIVIHHVGSFLILVGSTFPVCSSRRIECDSI